MARGETETARENLLKSMKRTKGVRFNASKRLEKSERSRTSTIAYASVSVIVLTIMPAFFKLPPFIAGLLSLVTVGMSVVILTATLIQNSDAGMVKSDQFHRCALEVNALRRTLMASESENQDLTPFAEKYNDIMQRYGLNHDAADYAQYRAEHPDEFSDEYDGEVRNESPDQGQVAAVLDSLPKFIAVTTVTAIIAALVSVLPTVLPSVVQSLAESWELVSGLNSR